MYENIKKSINSIKQLPISAQRKQVLKPLIDYIIEHINGENPINLNFICTHNSRRSHLSQIWMQVCAGYFNLNNIYTFSGGTESTAMYPVVKTTLESQGFKINTIGTGENPIYAIRYSDNRPPIIAFSKKYDATFNPTSKFGAIMTCNHADENCPVIPGAEKRIPITYLDPKISDHTDQQKKVYLERSNQIASEMYYVLEEVTKILTSRKTDFAN